MRLLIQRVSEASVSIEGQVYSLIGPGLLVFLGICRDDTAEVIPRLVRKLVELRIFSDLEGKVNLSVADVEGELLIVSQFTLHADCKRGRRPDFTRSAPPRQAEELYHAFITELAGTGLSVKTGVFAADMQVSLVNDGPVTILLDSETL